MSRLEAMAQTLREQSERHAELVGGFPDDIEVVGDRICIASSDEDGKPTLEILDADDAVSAIEAFDE